MNNVLKVIDLKNLKQFEWTSSIVDPLLNVIWKTARNLRKLRFGTDPDDINAQVKAVDIRNLFTHCPLLRYLELEIDKQSGAKCCI